MVEQLSALERVAIGLDPVHLEIPDFVLPIEAFLVAEARREVDRSAAVALQPAG